MRIAVLFSGDMENLSLGGIDRYLKSIISQFDDNVFTVFGTGVNGQVILGKKYEKEYAGKKYSFIPISDDRRRPLSFYYLFNEVKYLKKFKDFDYIYIQRTEYTLPFLFFTQKEKIVQIIHGSSKYSFKSLGRTLKKVYLIVEKIAIGIAPTTFIILNRDEFGVPYYRSKYRNHADKIFYAYNPINTAVFHKKDNYECKNRLKILNDNKIIIYVGRIEDDPKRVLKFPSICQELNRLGSKCTFLILGNGQDEKKLKQETVNRQVDSQFIFAGYIETVDVIADYYNISDVAINISSFEGTCTSNLEAIACGTPVVSTDVGDIHEIIGDGKNGIIIPNTETDLVKNAALAINHILKDSVVMTDTYMKYDAKKVAEQLRENFFKEIR